MPKRPQTPCGATFATRSYSRITQAPLALTGLCEPCHGAWAASLPARSNSASLSFAGTTVPGHLARAGFCARASATGGTCTCAFCSRRTCGRGILHGLCRAFCTCRTPLCFCVGWAGAGAFCTTCAGVSCTGCTGSTCAGASSLAAKLGLLQQGSRWILADICLALTGGFRSISNFVAGRRAPCSRRQA